MLRKRAFDVKQVVEEAKRLVADAETGPTTRAITEAAEKRGIPCRRDGTGNRIQPGYGKHTRCLCFAPEEQDVYSIR